MWGKGDRAVDAGGCRHGRLRAALGPGGLTAPFRAIAGNRSLSWLVLAFAAVSVAEWSYVTALAVEAFRADGAVAVGLVGFRLFIAAVGSVFNIRYIERHPSGRVLTVIAGTRATLVAISALLAASGAPLALLLILLAIDAFVSTPYRPSQSALIPVLARTPKEVASSAAAMSTVKTLGQALGAVAGGFLLTIVSPAAVFTGAAVTLAGAAALTMPLAHTPIPVADNGAPSGVGNVMLQTLAIARHPHVGGILVVSGLRTFVRGMWLAIALIASLRLLHAGSAGVGLLMLAAGIGALAAVPISAGLISRSRLGTPVALALVACGFPLALIAGVPVLDVAFVLVVAWGVGMAVADVTTLSLLYRLLDTPLLPRAIGAIESAKLALEGLGAVLAPLLVSILGIRGALIVAGLLLPVAAVTGWRTLHQLDAAAGERSSLLALLHGVRCFQPLDMAALESLASRLRPLTVPAGTEVVRQGEQGDRFYVVRDGTAAVLVDWVRSGLGASGRLFRGESTPARRGPDGDGPHIGADAPGRPLSGGLSHRGDWPELRRRQPQPRSTRRRELALALGPAKESRGPVTSQPPFTPRLQRPASARRPERRRSLAGGLDRDPAGRRGRSILRGPRRTGPGLGERSGRE